MSLLAHVLLTISLYIATVCGETNHSIVRNDTGEYFIFSEGNTISDIVCNYNTNINENCFIICNGYYACISMKIDGTLATNISILCKGESCCRGGTFNVSNNSNINLLCDGKDSCSWIEANFVSANNVNIGCFRGNGSAYYDAACEYSIFDLRYTQNVNIVASNSNDLTDTVFYLNGTVNPNNINLTCIENNCPTGSVGETTKWIDYIELDLDIGYIIDCSNINRSWGCQDMIINATYANSLTVLCHFCTRIEVICPINGDCNLICDLYCQQGIMDATQSINANLICNGICQSFTFYGPNNYTINNQITSTTIKCFENNACQSSQFIVSNTYNVDLYCNATSSYACDSLILDAEYVNNINIYCIQAYDCHDSTFNLSFANQINHIECVSSSSCRDVMIYAADATYLSLNCYHEFSCNYLILYCPDRSSNSCNIDCGPCCDFTIRISDNFEWNFLSITGVIAANDKMRIYCLRSNAFSLIRNNITFDSIYFNYGCVPRGEGSYYGHYGCCPWKLNDITCIEYEFCTFNCTDIGMCEDRYIDASSALSLDINCYSNNDPFYGYCSGSKIICPNTESECNIYCADRNSCKRVVIYTSNLTTSVNINCYGILSCSGMSLYSSSIGIDINIQCIGISSCYDMNIEAIDINDINLDCNASSSCYYLDLFIEDASNVNINCLDVESCGNIEFKIISIVNNINILCSSDGAVVSGYNDGSCASAQIYIEYSHNVTLLCIGYANCDQVVINASTSNNFSLIIRESTSYFREIDIWCPYKSINSCNILSQNDCIWPEIDIWIAEEEFIYGYLNAICAQIYCYSLYGDNQNYEDWPYSNYQSLIDGDCNVHGINDKCCPLITNMPSYMPTPLPVTRSPTYPTTSPTDKPTELPIITTTTPTTTPIQTKEPTKEDTADSGHIITSSLYLGNLLLITFYVL